MNVILLGSPGAGKGTQAKFITDHYHIPQISTGDILRAAIASGNDLGKKIKHIVDQGELVPDAIVISLVKERLQKSDCSAGFLLDGFPRTLAQAQALAEAGVSINNVIDLEVDENEVIKRLNSRQRADDSEETVRKRLAVYRRDTYPLRAYYKDLPGYIRIDGSKPIKEVREQIFSVLDSSSSQTASSLQA